MIPQLTPRLKRMLRRCFVKIDENTIEIKEKRGVIIKLWVLFTVIVFGYYDFIHPNYRKNTYDNLQLIFFPDTYYQKKWERFQSPERPDFDILGRKKEEFMNVTKNANEDKIWKGYIFYIIKYLILFLILLKPAKRRARFDRKRGIIYTYMGKKLYVTEINKLMRPFPEYIVAINATVFFWVHPYKNKGTGGLCLKGPQISVIDRSAWFPMFALLFLVYIKPEVAAYNTAPYLKKILVDFMDPETPQERIDEILNAIDGKKGFFERISGFLFNWIDSGLYTKKLPKQAILEEKLEAYFDKEAPNIHELASYRIANNFDSAREQFKVVLIISPEQNRKQGFDKVPCPNLFKYPNESLHFSKLLGTWGNVQDESNTSLAELEKQQGKKKRKKRK